MTNSISQTASIQKTLELSASQSGNSWDSAPKTEGAFQFLLNQNSGNAVWNRSPAPKADWRNTVEMGEKQSAYEKESVQSAYKDKNIVSKDTGDFRDKLSGDARESLEQVAGKVEEVLQEKLGMTEEELTQAMEALGMTSLDLLNPVNLAAFVMQVTGAEDMTALLLNEDFQSLFTEMSQMTKELSVQLGIKPEEVALLLDRLKEADSTGSILSPESGMEEGIEAAEPETPNPADVKKEASAESTVKTAADAGTVQTAGAEQAKGQNGLAGEPGAGQQYTAQEESAVQQGSQQNQEGAKEDTYSGQDQPKSHLPEPEIQKGSALSDKAEYPQGQITYQTTTQTVNAPQGPQVIQTTTQSVAELQDVIRQISQMTRVVVGQAESSIEMQLNPAELGKIYLQVAEKNGVITAHLAAQNEAVKEALESQAVLLKENMNQQGLKVEAVEVTIASHEFDRSLEENQHSPQQEQQEAETGKKTRRNINLNEPDALEGILTEEENLAAKMMAEHGNSMDLTA